MKKTAPVHIKKFCYEDNDNRIYRELQEEIYDEVYFLWKIKCECGETKFKVFTDEHPSVFCKCSQCDKDITAHRKNGKWTDNCLSHWGFSRIQRKETV